MTKRQRIDSHSAAVQVMQAAVAGDVTPPPHDNLPDGAMPFWWAIVRGRARGEWQAAPWLLSTAASLAWVQWQISEYRALADGRSENTTELNMGQLLSRLSEMQRIEQAYLRALQQHGRGVGGEAREASKRSAIAKGIEGDNPLEDDLLARPN